MRLFMILCFLFTICTSALSSPLPGLNQRPEEEEEASEKIDDWQFNQRQVLQARSAGGTAQAQMGGGKQGVLLNRQAMPRAANIAIGKNVANMGAIPAPAAKSLGFAVGGAKDTASFNQNLERGYLPKYDSITYEGLFYDYYFDTGAGEGRCKTLFCPSFSRAVTRDLYSGETDYYLSVGLNSGLTEESFQRKRLNLVVVVDISGSMGAPFDRYYYDANRSKSTKAETTTKMQIANESIVAMMKHLAVDDRFGVVLFDDQAYLAKPLRLVRSTDMKAISRHILELREQGGTNWKAGYDEGVKLFDSIKGSFTDPTVYENRIVFLTDAMPNIGELGREGLFGMVRDAAQNGIYTSFVGVGVDFNPDLVEHVTKTRGANYFSVHSASEFKKRLADEFDYMVTPLVFDLQLQVASENFTIEGVFGSPEADLATGEVMKINTLFPSPTEEERVKGGVVLVKFKKTAAGSDPVHLTVRYKDRAGKQFEVTDTADFAGDRPGFDNSGIRKAVLLTEYVSLIKNWILDARKGCNDQVQRPVILPLPRCGIINPQVRPEVGMLQTWERKSCPLEVSPGYRNFLTLFSKHFSEQMQIIGDKTLEKEFKILTKLSGANSASSSQDKRPIDDWKVK